MELKRKPPSFKVGKQLFCFNGTVSVILYAFHAKMAIPDSQKNGFLNLDVLNLNVETGFLNLDLQILRWNLKNLSRGLNPPKPGLN